MSVVSIYLAAIVLTLAVSISVVLVLRRPLQNLLVDLCGTPTRAAFWAAFSNVTLVLAPLLGAMHRRPDEGVAVFELAAQLEWALGGLLGSVLLVGVVLARTIMAFERQQRSAARTAHAVSAAG
jgi:hypothetical protein